jgi:hypothetical protein
MGVSRSASAALLFLLTAGEMTVKEFRARHAGFSPHVAFQVLINRVEDEAWGVLKRRGDPISPGTRGEMP